MNTIRLALDWTPNVNHVGFLVAYESGYYQDAGIDLQIIDPSIDNYATTPAKRVELGTADLALCPTESLISYQTKSEPFDLVAIAAVLQSDLSAIAVLESSSIQRPTDLDGRIYSSYAARYEDAIVRAMVKNDGGQGDFRCVYPDKLGIWSTLVEGGADATWIFINWEGVAAAQKDIGLREFKMADYGIPYSYSPVVAGSRSVVSRDQEMYGRFIKASALGHQRVIDEPQVAAEVLGQYVPESDSDLDLYQAISLSSPHFISKGKWGSIDRAVMQTFLDWLRDEGLESQELVVDDLVLDLTMP